MDKYQLRAARAMLGLSLQQLAQAVDISHEAINKIESGAVINPRPKTLEVLVEFFEQQGLEFDRQSSVRFRRRFVKELEGGDSYVKLLDDVYHTLGAGEELLIACADDSISPPEVHSAHRRMREKGIRIRKLVEEGNTYIKGPLDEYRYLPKEHFTCSVFLVYQNKIGNILNTDDLVLIIEDPELANAYRGVFNVCWQAGERPIESIAPERFS